MKNCKLLYCVAVVFVVMLALSSMAFGTNLSQTELDEPISGKIKYEGNGFNNAEEAVTFYLEGLKNMDFEQMLGAFAWETQIKHYSLETRYKMMRSYSPVVGWARLPSSNGFIFSANVSSLRASIVNEIYTSVEAYIFGDTYPDRPISFKTDEEVVAFLQKMKMNASTQLDKLSKLSNIRFVSPDSVTNNKFSSENNQKSIARAIAMYGADEITNIVAIADVDDETLICSPTVARYGNKWYIVSPSSSVSVLLGIDNYHSSFLCGKGILQKLNIDENVVFMSNTTYAEPEILKSGLSSINTQTEKDDYVELNPQIFKTEDDREAQATENAYKFEQKITELANQISSSNQYSYQDMELVEGNTMVADEIVYMRAWQGKGYFFIRNYENKSWLNNHLTHFYINDKSSVNFTGRIKIGCTLDDLTAVFGDKLEWSSDRPSEWTLTTRSNWIMNFYISSKGYVHEIQYTTVGSITSKMSLLYAFNSGELLAADVASKKVNIRDYPDASGSNVVFQVNRSKDVLLIIDKDNSHAYAVYNNYGEDWYRVVGRISGNKFTPVEGEAYVIYKYINIRPMTNAERNMVSSALN